MLLAEYGFTLGRSNNYNNVGIDEQISSLFEAQGETGRIKRGILEEEGYWGSVLRPFHWRNELTTSQRLDSSSKPPAR